MKRGVMALAMVAAVVAATFGIGTATKSADAAGPFSSAHAGGPYSGVAGVPVQFNGSASSGQNLSFVWQFGDGTAASGVIVNKSFATAGYYNVSLTVTDIFGQTSTSYTTVGITGSTYAYPYVYNGVYAPYVYGTSYVSLTPTVTTPTIVRTGTTAVASSTGCTTTIDYSVNRVTGNQATTCGYYMTVNGLTYWLSPSCYLASNGLVVLPTCAVVYR